MIYEIDETVTDADIRYWAVWDFWYILEVRINKLESTETEMIHWIEYKIITVSFSRAQLFHLENFNLFFIIFSFSHFHFAELETLMEKNARNKEDPKSQSVVFSDPQSSLSRDKKLQLCHLFFCCRICRLSRFSFAASNDIARRLLWHSSQTNKQQSWNYSSLDMYVMMNVGHVMKNLRCLFMWKERISPPTPRKKNIKQNWKRFKNQKNKFLFSSLTFPFVAKKFWLNFACCFF